MDIETLDLRRMFLGDFPLIFLAEVVFRTSFLYGFTFILVRAMRRQALGQLSLVEVLLIVAVGSAVGDPMFYADVPLLHGMVVIATVVTLNELFAALVRRSPRFESLLEGKPSRVAIAGRVDRDGIRSRGMSAEELYELLRNAGVESLGEVRVAYIEQNGLLSLFRYPRGEERVGLALEPPDVLEPSERYRRDDIADVTALYACCSCGEVREFRAGVAVPLCDSGHADWARRVREAGRTSSENRGAPD